MIGQTFARLTVISFDHSDGHYQKHWRCRCECGNETVVRADKLKRGQTRSCGCLRPEARPEIWLKNNLTWVSWNGMMHRCYDPNTRNFRYWGGKGVTVCERWHTYENFRADMGERPSAELTIDRINGDGNYEPGNCRWATRSEQRRNAKRPQHYRVRRDKGVKRGKYRKTQIAEILL